jgi:hypothetical protein
MAMAGLRSDSSRALRTVVDDYTFAVRARTAGTTCSIGRPPWHLNSVVVPFPASGRLM